MCEARPGFGKHRDVEKITITLKKISSGRVDFYNVSVKSGNADGVMLYHTRKPLSPAEALMDILSECFGVTEVTGSVDGTRVTATQLRKVE